MCCRMELPTSLLFLMAFSLSGAAPLEYQIIEEQTGAVLLGNVAGDGGLGRKFDRSDFRQLRYSFLQQQDPLTQYFAIDAVSGDIRAIKLIDRDAICAGLKDCQIKLDVAVGPAKFFQIVKVIVHVKDLNDNSPKFPERKISRHISEGASHDKTISIPTAEDPDSPAYGIQHYRIDTPSHVFQLNTIKSIDGSVDLQLTLKGELDREREPYIIVNITAIDGGSRPRTGRLTVNVTIDDANDNVAQFINTSYEFRVKESMVPNSVIAQVKATDEDSGLNGQISYSFGSRTLASFGDVFKIQENSGFIVLKQKLDYEKVKEYHLTVIAKDRGPNSQPSQATVNIIVLDINDHAPTITVNTFIKTGRAQVLENSKPGTFVAHVSVDDKDGGRNGNFTCDINDSRFVLQRMYKTEFKVLTVIRFNREMQTQLTIAITCRDNAVNPKSSQKYIDIDIKDANDHIPQFLRGRYEAQIKENNQIEDFLVQVNATDQDVGDNAMISYRIDRDYARLFKINPITGRVVANTSYDRENVSEYRFRVLAVDHGKPALTGTATVHLKILDLDDEGPNFSQKQYAFGVLENEPPGTEVGKVIATDPDTAPFNELRYSIDWPKKDKDPIFVINAISGKVNTKKMLDREAKSDYHFVVKATSVKKPDISTSASVTVYVADKNDNLPEFVVPMEPNNTVHISSLTPQGYAVYQVFARDLDSGGNAKISYVINRGNKDNTFRINRQNGHIFVHKSLAPYKSQTFELELQASDQGNPKLSSTAILYITINDTLDVMVNLDPNASFTSDNSSSYLSGINLTILISVSIVSVFLILVLALGIILLKCHERRHKPPVRNGSVISLGETQEMLQHPHNNSVYDVKGIPDGQESPHMCHDGHHRGRHHHHLRPHKKEVSFKLNLEDSGCIDGSQSPSPNGAKDSHKNHQPAYQVSAHLHIIISALCVNA